MDGTLWIAAIALAIGLWVSGFVKANTGREKLVANPRMVWVEDFSDPAIRTIGGLAITMLGAIMVHVRRADGALSVGGNCAFPHGHFVAWGKIGAYAF